MVAALYNFNNLRIKYREFEAVVIIGDMLELGNSATKMHLNLVPLLKGINPNLILTLGKYTKKINEKLIKYNKNELVPLKPSSKEKINIGFVSADIRNNHSITHFLKSILIHNRRNKYNIFLFINSINILHFV